MARQVFFDPFSAYVGGYETGANREQSLQQATRQARQQDLDYGFNQYADPFRRNALQVGQERNALNLQREQNNLFRDNLDLAKLPSQVYGIADPFRELINQRYGITQQSMQAPPQARLQYLQNLEGLFNDLAPGTTPAEMEQLKRDNALALSSYLGNVSPEQLMSDRAGYVMQYGGQPATTMADPNEAINAYIRRPDVLQEAQRLARMQADAEAAARAQAYLQIQQQYATRKANPTAAPLADALEGF